MLVNAGCGATEIHSAGNSAPRNIRMDADEVAVFPDAKCIRGTRTYRFEDEESLETIPAVFRSPPD